MMNFKGSQFERDIILWGVRWYVAYPISYRQLEEMMGERGEGITEARAADQLRYSLRDTLRSGFALMVFQHPRLLQFQRARAKKRQRCNLQTIFGVQEMPSDTQRRDLFDGVEGESLRGLLPQLWEKVRRAGGGGRFTTPLPSGQPQGT